MERLAVYETKGVVRMKVRAFVIVPRVVDKGKACELEVVDLTICANCNYHTESKVCGKKGCPCYARETDDGFFCGMGEHEEK